MHFKTHRVTHSSQSWLLPLMMDGQLATSLSLTSVPTKIFLFLKWEIFKRSWIRPVTERITWLLKALVFLVCPPLCVYCSSFFPATAFLFSINHSFFQATLGLSLCPRGPDSPMETTDTHLQGRSRERPRAWPLGGTRGWRRDRAGLPLKTKVSKQPSSPHKCHSCRQPALHDLHPNISPKLSKHFSVLSKQMKIKTFWGRNQIALLPTGYSGLKCSA